MGRGALDGRRPLRGSGDEPHSHGRVMATTRTVVTTTPLQHHHSLTTFGRIQTKKGAQFIRLRDYVLDIWRGVKCRRYLNDAPSIPRISERMRHFTTLSR